MSKLTSNKLTLSACCVTHGMHDGLSSSVYVLLPILAQHFSLGFSQIGLIRAVYTGAMWLLEIPAGILSERLGERRLLVLGIIGSGIGFFAVSFTEGYYGVLLALFVAGCGAAFQHSLCSSLISKSFGEPERRIALGSYNASGDIGKLAFTLVASLLLGIGVGWQTITLGYGLLAVAVALNICMLLNAKIAGKLSAIKLKEIAGSNGWGIKDRLGFTNLAAIVFIDSLIQDGFLVFITFVMIEKQVSTGLVAFAVAATLSGGICGKFAGGLLAARIGVIRSIVLFELLTAIGIMLVFYAPGNIPFFLLPLVGVFLQGSSSITYGTVSNLVHTKQQSRGFSIIYTIANSASFVGPAIFGLIIDFLGFKVMMMIMATLVLVTLPLCYLLKSALERIQSSIN
ncbi:MAG: MFS transporter [Pseudomonadales bacterium]|nr:MFS transporter [Pseudomonadales bacterium]